ncbi:HTH-type transcriptional activator Btr [compost metagenome]
MMLRGEGRIYEISQKLGYESAFYFSKVFKKVTGMSPREYMQQIEAGSQPERSLQERSRS